MLNVGLAEANSGFLSHELTNTEELRVLAAETNNKAFNAADSRVRGSEIFSLRDIS